MALKRAKVGEISKKSKGALRHTSPVYKVGTGEAVKSYLSPVGGQLPQDLVEIASTWTRGRRLLDRVLEVHRGEPRPETRALAWDHALVAEEAARVGAVGAVPFDHGAGGDGDGLVGPDPAVGYVLQRDFDAAPEPRSRPPR